MIEKMASESTKIVSLTITEGGYNISHTTGEFDASDPDVMHDLEPGTLPRTTFGLICAALALRRDRGLAPFTIMSCDNIEGNGSVAKTAVGAFAALKDPELAEWIDENGAFPNSMVDRITPVTTAEVTTEIAETFGVEDQWPVAAEPFTAWFLEDEFTSGRPPLENAGVNLVPDVRPYELMKLRLLNAGHQGIAYFGYLAGYRLVHEACQDELLSGFLLDYMNLEATPTLDPVPGVDLDQYKKTLIERFSNPQVRDTIARLCAESSDRIPKWLLPVIRTQLDTGGRSTCPPQLSPAGHATQRHRRERRSHHRRRSAVGHSCAARPETVERPVGLHRVPTSVRRSRGRSPICRKLPKDPRLVALRRGQKNPRGGARALTTP